MTTESQNPAPPEQYVKVLYDYEYTDDFDSIKVAMCVDEVYRLLNTDSNEWWQVSRPSAPDKPFYVPSAYVEVLSSGNDKSLDGVNTMIQTGHNGGGFGNITGSSTQLNTFNNNVKMNNQGDSSDQESDYINVQTFKMPEGSDMTVQYIPTSTRPSDDSGEYANLDDIRNAANMQHPQQQSASQPQESDYANLQQLNLGEQVPSSSPPQFTDHPNVDACEFKRTLTDLTMDTWDQYLDPTTNRLFYIHNKTQEFQWKPPRGGQFHNQLKEKRMSGDYEEVFFPVPTRSQRKSRSLDYGKPRLSLITNVPDGWTVDYREDGEAVFTDTKTSQKWLRAKDTTGQDYYYRWHSGTFDSVWQLPPRSGGSSPTKSPTSDPEDQIGSLADHKSSSLTEKPRKSQVSDRFQKSRSVMIESLHFTAPPHSVGQQAPKSATLPPNFTSAIPEVPVEEEGSRRGSGPDAHQSQPFLQTVNLNEPIEGVLNKCVLVNGKKSAKKWAYSYVKLSGSNLQLFKEQKITPKSGPIMIVALVTCTVEKDAKSFTSKKNTLCITNAEHHILLQAEDDTKIQEWFIKLHTKIEELGGNPNPVHEGASVTGQQAHLTPESMPTRKPSFKNKHKRQESDGGTLEKKSKMKILSDFFGNRSDKEKLVKKGIYKDAVFGSDIKQLCDKEKSKVPNFVVQSIEAIERRGLEHEGLYRIGGNVSQIQTLRCMVDQGESYNLDDPMWDVNVLCGCLKLFFRELKEPLFTYPLFDKFLKGFLKEAASDRLKAIKSTVSELPKAHYETIKVLFKHLTKVMENSLQNKMQAHQLAIVFGPTLIWPETQSKNLATMMVYQSRIVEFILLEYTKIFR